MLLHSVWEFVNNIDPTAARRKKEYQTVRYRRKVMKVSFEMVVSI